jgi:peptide-methionine (S)-S-oxide reductase
MAVNPAGASCLLVPPHELPEPRDDLPAGEERSQTIVLAGGCFWCTEAVFQQLDGVLRVTPGYAGGTRETADYRTVCTGATGHAEVVQVEYDPRRISFGRLLKVFFSVAHDPTQLNRQGNDYGTQYRSAIFYERDEQRRVAAAYIAQLEAAQVFSGPIMTTLEPLTEFFPAEGYHHNYAARNPDQPYIAYAALPKVEKLRQFYADQLKPSQGEGQDG